MIAVEDPIKAQVKALSLINYTLIFGLLLFLGLSYLLIDTIQLPITDKGWASNLSIGLILFLIVSAGMIYGSFSRKQNEIREGAFSRDEKLKKYRSAFIINIVLLEAIGVTGIICFLLTGKPMALIAPCMSIIQMFGQRPTIKSVNRLLELE